MGEITALSTGRGRGKRVNVFLDGKFAFSLEAEVAAGERLQVGEVLSEAQIEALVRSDALHRCLNVAGRYLGYRPRSEAELRERLRQRGFDHGILEAVMARLKEQGLVDDVAFAQFWKDEREASSPRSRALTRLELRQKGVARDILDQVVGTIDDDENAYRAARDKAHRLFHLDYEGFRRRLGGYLRRRGFSYGVINHTVERVWQEQGGGSPVPENGQYYSGAVTAKQEAV